MKNWRVSLFLYALSCIVLVVGTAVAADIRKAKEPGQCQTVTTTSEVAIPAHDKRSSWTLWADDGNTDELRWWMSDATITTATGFILNAGVPVGDGDGVDVYAGVVTVIAESGTQTYCTAVY